MAARKQQNPLASGNAVYLQDGSFQWEIPTDTLRQLVAVGAAGSGIVLANVQQKFSLLHATVDENGQSRGDLPVNYTISVRITRDPLPGNDTERKAVETAAGESKAKADERKQSEQKERERLVANTQQLTRDMLREGMALAGGSRANVAETIQQIAAVAPAVKALAGVFGSQPNAQ